MDDFISRHDAIGAISVIQTYKLSEGDDMLLIDKAEAQTELMLLPSADVVEVVRCKDCRWGKEVCGNIECFADVNVPPEYHGYEWFCPNGERRSE